MLEVVLDSSATRHHADCDQAFRQTATSPVLHFSPHETIFSDGDILRGVYELIGGTVALSKLMPDGRRQIVELLRGGDVLNTAEQTEADADAQALTTVRIRRLSFAQVRQSPADQARLALALGSQLARMRSHALLLGRKSAHERVAQFLMQLMPGHPCEHCRQTEVPAGPGEIDLVMTRQEIADYLGLTIETVSRAFSELKRNRVISYGRHDLVTVANGRELCALAGCGSLSPSRSF